jgi:CDP-glycerol glycerophosphotransferase (TagB/SpsB family)
MIIHQLNKLNIIFDNNIFHLKYFPETKIDIDTAQAVYEYVIASIKKNKKYAILTELAKKSTMTRQARDFFGSRLVENIMCNAILIKNEYQRALADLYIFFSKPKIETKFFTSETKARNWIKEKIG